MAWPEEVGLVLGVDGGEVLYVPIVVSSLWFEGSMPCFYDVGIGDGEDEEHIILPMIDILARLVSPHKKKIASLEDHFLPLVVVLVVDEEMGVIV